MKPHHDAPTAIEHGVFIGTDLVPQTTVTYDPFAVHEGLLSPKVSVLASAGAGRLISSGSPREGM